jgi:hypothetical protein
MKKKRSSTKKKSSIIFKLLASSLNISWIALLKKSKKIGRKFEFKTV